MIELYLKKAGAVNLYFKFQNPVHEFDNLWHKINLFFLAHKIRPAKLRQFCQ